MKGSILAFQDFCGLLYMGYRKDLKKCIGML